MRFRIFECDDKKGLLLIDDANNEFKYVKVNEYWSVDLYKHLIDNKTESIMEMDNWVENLYTTNKNKAKSVDNLQFDLVRFDIYNITINTSKPKTMTRVSYHDLKSDFFLK